MTDKDKELLVMCNGILAEYDAPGSRIGGVIGTVALELRRRIEQPMSKSDTPNEKYARGEKLDADEIGALRDPAEAYALGYSRGLAAKDAELEEKRWLMADLTAAIENKNADITRYKRCHDELLEIHKVIMCVAEVTEAKDSDPYTLKAVKQMAMRINEIEGRTTSDCEHKPLCMTREQTDAMRLELSNAQCENFHLRDELLQSREQVERLRKALEFVVGHMIQPSSEGGWEMSDGWWNYDYDGVLASLDDQPTRKI